MDPIFTSDFATAGLRNYTMRNPATMTLNTDYGLCPSPAGDGETVAWFNNSRHLTNGNEYQRSQLQAQSAIAPVGWTQYNWGNRNSVYVEYVRVWLDARYPMSRTSQWVSIFEVHGGPYLTSSALGLMVVFDPATQSHYLRLGNDPSYLGKAVPFETGRWVQLARQYKYEYAAKGGWADLWYNLTPHLNTGWVRARINGGYRRPLDVIRRDAGGARTEGGGWVDDPIQLKGQRINGKTYTGKWAMSHSKVGLYSNHYSTLYVAQHRVGRTFKNTMPSGWSGRFNGVNPDVI